ncbi:hypothetical protein [Flagellimonas sp.]|uniref:hypothetical protein n=1 Tax=Flagellimonas sp. TaxID=2058762 RepID=UPI003B50F37F
MIQKLKGLIKIFILVDLILIINSCKQSHKIGLFGQENAVWTESIYLRGYKPSNLKKLSDNDLRKYANTLKRNRIKYAYLFAGPYDEKGFLPDYAFSSLAKESVRKLKKYYPEIVILPWIGGVQNKTVYLGNSAWVENALKDTEKLVQVLDVPGVHVDFEYILKDNPYLDRTINPEKLGDKETYGKNVNEFHKKLRALLPDKFISSVVVSSASDTKPWKRKTTFSELETLIKYVDQLSFLFYDTHIDSQEVFEKNCVEQLNHIKALKRFNTNTQFLISIGTFVNRLELQDFRNLTVESVPNSLETIKKSSIAVNDSEKIVDGISIFCDWHTEKREWAQFREHWVEKQY